MLDDTAAAIIAHELAVLVLRIESLPAHPQYTAASLAVEQAKKAIEAGRADLHGISLRVHFKAA